MGDQGSLYAVLFADLENFSGLVSRDEDGTLAFMEHCFRLAETECAAATGELVKKTGDGFVMLFRSATNAIRFSLAVHKGIAEADDGTTHRLRIGVHLGEVRRDNGDVHGHSVNIAARLEALAEPGTTLVSQTVYREARSNAICGFVSKGVPVLKNIPERIATYRIVEDPAAHPGEATTQVWFSAIDGCAALTTAGPLVLPRSGGVLGLLGTLVLSRRHRIAHAKIAALLWPERDTAAALRSLARSRRLLEQTLVGAPHVLGRDSQQVWIDLRFAVIDLDRLLEQVERGQVEEPLLQGIDWKQQLVPDIDRLGTLIMSWASVARQTWQRRFADALERCIDRFDPPEEGARRAASALLCMEPGHEPAARLLIRHYIARGNRGAALAAYSQLCDHLIDRYGIEPAPETVALVDHLRQATEKAPEAEAPTVSGSDRLIILIEHFREPDAGDDHRIAGFRMELIANLARFREWSVIEQSGAQAGTVETDREGRYILSGQGAMNEGCESLRLNLREEASGRIVWSDSFEISLSDWDRLQRQVIGRIAATLEIYMSADRLAHALSTPGGGVAIRDSWLRGEQLLTRWSAEAEDEAEAIFKQIITQVPDFAPAFASLASIHNVRHVIRPGLTRDREADRTAFRLGQRAIELDPMDARSQLAVAWSAALAGAFDQAMIHLDLAVTLNRNSPKTAISAAMGYAFFGDPERASDLLDRTQAIAPLLADYQWCYIASVRYLAGDDPAALAATERSGDQIIDNQGWRAAALCRLGRLEEARRAFDRLVETVSHAWAGPDRPLRGEVYDWFVNAYPIRRPEDWQALAEPLAQLCGGHLSAVVKE